MSLSNELLAIIEEENDAIANMVQVVRLTETAKIPTYATAGSAGLDLYADEPAAISGGAKCLISCGIALALPPGYVAMVCPRSGLALKYGVTVLNSPGIIDSDYRGPIHALLHNTSGSLFIVHAGDRIAQMVILPYVQAKFREKLSLDSTARGAGGFGSTGL